MKKLIFLLLLLNFNSFSQSVSIGIFEKGYFIESKVRTTYESLFGVGNVTIINYANNYTTPLATLKQHDIIMLSVFFDLTVPKSLADNLASLYKDNKHLMLSTEGSELTTGERISAYVWNKITGQSITETKGGAYGTINPPRFHPSNGPGGLSQHDNLTASSTSYASFGNLFYLNVIHQRTKDEPDCSNVEGLDALFPHIPKIGKGTIYINGEIYYPYYSSAQEVVDLGTNLAKLYHALLASDQAKLKVINSWSTDPAQQQNLNIKKEDITFVAPNVITPNADKINDEFVISFKTLIPSKIDIKIYNRWGNMVFSSQSINFKWDGKDKYSSKPLEEGVYFYTLNLIFENECSQTNEEELAFDFKGNISIFK